MKRSLVFFLFVVLPLAAFAEQNLKPEDFAYGIPITAGGDSSVYEADLPLDVYRNAVRPDLGDVRVFNADGSQVPHTIADGGRTEEDLTSNRSLDVFPLFEGEDQSPDALSVKIRRGPLAREGTEVDVSSSGVPQAKKVSTYLFFTASAPGPLRALTLFWDWTGQTFVTPITLEASDDLKSWRSVENDAVISQLAVDEVSLRKNKIEFAPVRAAYFRLKLPQVSKDAGGLSITSAEAEYVTGVKTAEREWLTVKGVPSKAKPRAFDFDAGVRVPVDRLEVLLPEGNHLISADLLAADAPNEPNKSLAYSGILYRLRQSGHEVTTGPIRPSVNADLPSKKLWSLELRDDSTGLEGQAPSLKLGWVPQKLVFVAQGKGPFLLAYGSGGARKARFEVESVVADRGKALLGRQKELGGPSKLLPPPPSPPSFKEIWGKRLALAGMTLATLLLGWMAFRLARQMA